MQHIKILVVALSTMVLVACGSNYKTVKVRDYYCPAPNIPVAPDYAINTITASSTDAEVGIAYAKTVDQLFMYNKELLHELRAYEKMGKVIGSTEDVENKPDNKTAEPKDDISTKYDL